MDYNNQLKKHYIKLFLRQYKKYYTQNEISYLKTSYNPNLQVIEMPDILRQILDKYNLLTCKENVYNKFIEIISTLYSLDQNIIEVGGGVIPSLAKKIALQQKKGTITVYDPRIMPQENIPHLKLKKEKFTLNTNLNNTNLLIGFMPSTATEIIIKKACQEHIDFIIALCGEGYLSEDDYFEDIDEWIQYIMYVAKANIRDANFGTLGVNYELGEDYPIIFTKRQSNN